MTKYLKISFLALTCMSFGCGGGTRVIGDSDTDAEDSRPSDGLDIENEDSSSDPSADADADIDRPDGYVPPITTDFAEACETDHLGNECMLPYRCCVTSTTGQELCIDTSISSSNCGGCGQVCPYPAQCNSSFCIGPPGFSFCGCAWANLSIDPDHCGDCGNACPDGAACIDGECESTETSCPDGITLCGDGCRSLDTNAHCEECEIKCHSVLDEPGSRPVCSVECGECSKSESPLGWDVIGWNSHFYSGLCDNEGQVVWLNDECLEDCPPGFVRIFDFMYPDFDGSIFRDVCIPYNWDDSGPQYAFRDLYPRCGSPEFSCLGSGSACIDGDCTCMDGYSACPVPESTEYYPGTLCTDLNKDRNSCGSCWNRCASGEECMDGECT